MVLREVNDFLLRASERSGFRREIYFDKLIPANYDKIVVIPFFGDWLGELIFSSLLYQKVVETKAHDSYVIVVTHPGHGFLYPEASEVWGVNGEDVYNEMFIGAEGLVGDTSRSKYFYQNLNKFFSSVEDLTSLSKWYNKGLTGNYLESFGKVLVDLPPVFGAKPDVVRYLGDGNKVFLAASKRTSSRKVKKADRSEKEEKVVVSKGFYVSLAKNLMDLGLVPVFWNGPDCYDVSVDLPGIKVVTDRTLAGGVAAARSCGFVLSTFNDLFCLGIMARVPYLLVEERKRYFGLNLFETEDILGTTTQKPYFSFVSSVTENNYLSAVAAISNRVGELYQVGLPEISLTDSKKEADYGKVRRRRANKLGFRLFRPPAVED